MKKRQSKLWTLFAVSIGLILLIAFFDNLLIQPFFDINSPLVWKIYEEHTMKATWMFGMAIFLSLAIVWYIVYRDLSETVGLFLAGTIMLSTGLEDLFYFFWSSQTMSSCMAYLNNISFINWTSIHVLGETCVSSTGLYLNALFGIILAIIVFYILEKVN